jgi:hypothetical protein
MEKELTVHASLTMNQWQVQKNVAFERSMHTSFKTLLYQFISLSFICSIGVMIMPLHGIIRSLK